VVSKTSKGEIEKMKTINKELQNIGSLRVNFIGKVDNPRKDKKKTNGIGDMFVALFGNLGKEGTR
jgi:hypothetical protein